MAIVLRTRLVPIFLRRAQRLGVPIADVAEEAGLAGDAAERSEVAIGLPAFRTLARALAERAKDDLFGFHAALEAGRGDFGALEYVVRNAPSVRDALERLVKFQRAINEQVRVEFDPRTRRVTETIPLSPDCLGREGNDFAIAHKIRVGRELVDPSFRPLRVFFAHADPKRRAAAQELRDWYGGAELVFDAGFNGFELHADALAARVERADPALLAVLEERLHESTSPSHAGSDALADVRRAIADSLSEAEIGADVVAKRLGTSARTLQRRLASAGVGLRALVDDIRRDAALAYLADPNRTLSEIATRLGYSDVRAFTRAFRRWTGATPAAMRRVHSAE